MKKKPVYTFIKRLFDIFASFISIILLALPMLVVAIAIKCDSKGPVFFKQDRIGKNKKIFKILKFRSMYTDTDPNAPTHLLKDASSHITKVGRFIRKTSLDELPQIFNIFIGQMTFVGPRPALWNQDDLVEARDKYYANDVLPGVTGWAQINGRDALEIQEKARYDGFYVEKRNLWLDIKILFLTFFYVFKCNGVVEGGTGEIKRKKKHFLTVFYITNRLEIALIAEKAGVDRIWVDLETLGKEERQKNYDSVKSHHSIDDIKNIAPHLTHSQMLVRVNPINPGSKDEINAVIEAGAQIVMLPMWKTKEEVESFIEFVDGRATTVLLLETKEGVECLDDVLELKGVDEIHIGLNDLHLSYGVPFMFELLTDGTVENIIAKIKKKNIPYGVGGVSHLKDGLVPAEMIIMEHYRLGSTRVILSRGFCNQNQPLDVVEKEFVENMTMMRNFEKNIDYMTLEGNKEELVKIVEKVERDMKDGQRNNK